MYHVEKRSITYTQILLALPNAQAHKPNLIKGNEGKLSACPLCLVNKFTWRLWDLFVCDGTITCITALYALLLIWQPCSSYGYPINLHFYNIHILYVHVNLSGYTFTRAISETTYVTVSLNWDSKTILRNCWFIAERPKSRNCFHFGSSATFIDFNIRRRAYFPDIWTTWILQNHTHCDWVFS